MLHLRLACWQTYLIVKNSVYRWFGYIPEERYETQQVSNAHPLFLQGKKFFKLP